MVADKPTRLKSIRGRRVKRAVRVPLRCETVVHRKRATGTISLQLKNGGALIRDDTGMLIVDARTSGFPATIISSTGAIYGPEFASEVANGPIVTTGLRALEQIEYSPYGEPTVHARGVEGNAVMNLHEDTIRRGTSLDVKTNIGHSHFLSLADTEAPNTTQEYYSNNACTSSSLLDLEIDERIRGDLPEMGSSDHS